MKLPELFIKSLTGVPGFDKDAFEKVHQNEDQVTSIRINPSKSPGSNYEFPKKGASHDSRLTFHDKVPWCPFGYYLAERPSFTFDPLFHAGCSYVQQASSMFLEQVLKQTVDLRKPLKILDLCGAPGGKATHIQSLISKDSLLISNEVIKSRSRILEWNIIKWGCDNVIVSSNDPNDFAILENYFDVIMIDVPCSGSGLFRKNPEAIAEWSPAIVQLCCQRQKRIISDVFAALKNNGVLIYSTCSYSKEEDEDILDWITENLPVNNLQLTIDKHWNIIESQSKNKALGFRFFPDKVIGEGFFISAFKKIAGAEDYYYKIKRKPDFVSKTEMGILSEWTNTTDHLFIRKNDFIIDIPERLLNDLLLLESILKVDYAGVRIGELIYQKFVPYHALAMSQVKSNQLPGTELNYNEAIQYLQKKQLNLEIKNKGWQLVIYHGYGLGWINTLPNRINNYYPKELRILKN